MEHPFQPRRLKWLLPSQLPCETVKLVTISKVLGRVERLALEAFSPPDSFGELVEISPGWAVIQRREQIFHIPVSSFLMAKCVANPVTQDTSHSPAVHSESDHGGHSHDHT